MSHCFFPLLSFFLSHFFAVISLSPTVVCAHRNREKDLDEVLQIHQIFTNVSRGVVANKSELMEVFGMENQDEIIRLVPFAASFLSFACSHLIRSRFQILDKGHLQVSEKERQAAKDSKFKDIVNIVTEMCISRETQRPFSRTIIENSIKEVHYNVGMKASAKQQVRPSLLLFSILILNLSLLCFCSFLHLLFVFHLSLDNRPSK
jgi:ribosome maturation protein SDO1